MDLYYWDFPNSFNNETSLCDIQNKNSSSWDEIRIYIDKSGMERKTVICSIGTRPAPKNQVLLWWISRIPIRIKV